MKQVEWLGEQPFSALASLRCKAHGERCLLAL